MDKEIYYLMRVFCTVAETGSFSLAADKLGVQAPAVSKAIAKLERGLGKRLLNRSTRSLEISEVGHYFFKQAIEQLSSLNSALEVVESWNSSLKGSLKITSTHAIGEDLISNTIAYFCFSYPAVSMELMFTNELIRLPSQNIDIAIRSSNKLEDSSLRSKKLFSVKRLLVASPTHISMHGTPNKIDDLASHECLNFKHRKTLNSWSYYDKGQQCEFTSKSTITCNSYSALRRMCIQGMGVARLFEYQIKDELKNGTLVELLPDTSWGEQNIHAVYHDKMSSSPKIRAFIDHFQKHAFQNI